MYVGLKQPRGDRERYVTPARAAAKETSVAWKGTTKRSSIKIFETNSTTRSMLRVSFVFTPFKPLIYSQQSDETTLTKITTLTK